MQPDVQKALHYKNLFTFFPVQTNRIWLVFPCALRLYTHSKKIYWEKKSAESKWELGIATGWKKERLGKQGSLRYFITMQERNTRILFRAVRYTAIAAAVATTPIAHSKCGWDIYTWKGYICILWRNQPTILSPIRLKIALAYTSMGIHLINVMKESILM